jgi:hypothetical protein
LEDVEGDLKKMGFQSLQKNRLGYGGLETDPEGGQGPAWTVRPVDKRQGGRHIRLLTL